MDDMLAALPNEQEDVRLLSGCLAQPRHGVDLAYRLLDRMADRHRATAAWLVVRPEALGPQIFVRGRLPADPRRVADLVGRVPGLYLEGATADEAVSSVIAGCCELALSNSVAAAATGQHLAPGRASTERAVAQAAACSARYGWPRTALLLAARGGGDLDEGTRVLAAAVQAAARRGDEVGSAGPGRMLVLLGSAGPDGASAFVERVSAGVAARAARPPELETATVQMAAETVDPEEVWRLLDERLRTHGAPTGAAAAWEGAVPADLELELRSLPGVVAVGTSARGTVVGPQLTVVAIGADDGVHATAGRLVAAHFGEGAVPLVTVGASPSPGPAPWANGAANGVANGHERAVSPEGADTTGAGSVGPEPAGGPFGSVERRAGVPQPGGRPRIALLTARFDPVSGTSEVALGADGAHAVGRAAAGPLVGGAQATLAALGVLGVDVPFYLRSVGRARDLPGEPVVVVLAPRLRAADGTAPDPLARDRVGVASGEVEVEAASRATLGALNRFLSAG